MRKCELTASCCLAYCDECVMKKFLHGLDLAIHCEVYGLSMGRAFGLLSVRGYNSLGLWVRLTFDVLLRNVCCVSMLVWYIVKIVMDQYS